MATKPPRPPSVPIPNTPELPELSPSERVRFTKLRLEIAALRRTQLDAKSELDSAYDEWEKLDASIGDENAPGRTAELKRLSKIRDAAVDSFDTATEAFETRTAELLADPATEPFVRQELAEMEKRETYQSSQARGEGTTYGSCPHEFLYYQLKKSSIVKQSGENNPVYYPEIKNKGFIEPDRLLRFMTAGNSVKEGSVVAVMAELREAILFFTRMGFSVNLFDLFTVTPSLRGTCTQAETNAYFHRSFTPFLTARASQKLTRAFRIHLGARNAQQDTSGIVISGVFACPGDGTLVKTDAFAPGQIMQILGSRIRYNPDNPDEGFFLCTAPSGKTKYKIPRTGLLKDITPSRTTLFFPKEAVSGETLQLVLRKRLRNSVLLRTYFYNIPLTVK